MDSVHRETLYYNNGGRLLIGSVLSVLYIEYSLCQEGYEIIILTHREIDTIDTT